MYHQPEKGKRIKEEDDGASYHCALRRDRSELCPEKRCGPPAMTICLGNGAWVPRSVKHLQPEYGLSIAVGDGVRMCVGCSLFLYKKPQGSCPGLN
jgi:hypothetical protein